MRLLIVGNPDQSHVGNHFLYAARSLGFCTSICDVRRAFKGPHLLRRLAWRFCDKRPLRLRSFGQQLIAACERFSPDIVLVTGISPVGRSELARMRELGALCCNFLTDDPWNPAHRARWFLRSLPQYDCVFSPRQSNLHDLRVHGCRSVHYLPFGYSPEIHFIEPPSPAEPEFEVDLLFVGGADRDRIPIIRELLSQNFRLSLYGAYWHKDRCSASAWRGIGGPSTMRKATNGAKISLCLVRRANRDGHVMRSFEIPAMGGCMLAEDTSEHRAIYGAEGSCIRYFRDTPELIRQVQSLLAADDERTRLAQRAADLVYRNHSYAERLKALVEVALGERPQARRAAERI